MKLFKKLFYLFIFFFSFINLLNANEKEDIKNKIYKNLRCIVCQGQTIYESNSDFAVDLKKLIEKKLNNGETDQQIYDYLIYRYGDWIIMTPQFNKSNFMLWIIPIGVFLIGLLTISKITRKSKFNS